MYKVIKLATLILAIGFISSVKPYAIRYCGILGQATTPPLWLFVLDKTNNKSTDLTSLTSGKVISNSGASASKGPYTLHISANPQSGFPYTITIDYNANLYIVPCADSAEGFNVLTPLAPCNVTDDSTSACYSSCFNNAVTYAAYLQFPENQYCAGQSRLYLIPTMLDNTGYATFITVGNYEQAEPNFNVVTIAGQINYNTGTSTTAQGQLFSFGPPIPPNTQIKVTQNHFSASGQTTIQDSAWITPKPNTTYNVTLTTTSTGQKQFVITPT